MEDELRAASGVKRFVDDLSGAAFRERAASTPTCNISGISSGYAGPGIKTVLPARATALLDFRLVPDQQPDIVFKQLRTHLETEGCDDVELTLLASCEPVATPVEHPFVQQVAAVAERCSGMPRQSAR